MKLHNKIIFVPLLVMVAIFTFSLIGVEYQLKQTLERQFNNELHSRVSTTLSAISLIEDDIMPGQIHEVFDRLADQISQDSDSRISIFDQYGEVLGDSSLSLAEVLLAENHLNRPEVIEAKTKHFGRTSRFSNTLQQEMEYLAAYDEEIGYYVRVAMPKILHQSVLLNLRQSLIIILSVTLLVVLLVGIMAIRSIKEAVTNERQLQQARIIEHTREITLIQTMTTMLNAISIHEEAGQILANIMPKLLPELSGAIYLQKASDSTYTELVHWGSDWPGDITFIGNGQLNEDIDTNSQPTDSTNICEELSEHAINIRLRNKEASIGILHISNNQKPISKTEKSVAIQLADHITYALLNLRVKSQLRHQAIRDPLTNLFNRRFMLETFEQSLHHAERHERPLAILMVDLDHFKLFNDEFGHEAGDMVLIAVADLFIKNVRLEDNACRYGGEEFCIICPDTDLRDAYVLAEKLRNEIAQLQLSYEEKDLGKITISVGVAIFPNHANNTHDLIIQADKALYTAKRQGRNTTVVAQANAHYYEERS